MKSCVALIFFAAVSIADTAVPRKIWTVETSDPRPMKLDLFHGETVDLACRFTSYQIPIDVQGSTVTLHGRTNGMTEATSFQASGLATSNGLVAVHLIVDEWMPLSATNCDWRLEVVLTNGCRMLRSYGTATIAETGIPSSADYVPMSWLAPETQARINADAGLSNLIESVASDLQIQIDTIGEVPVSNEAALRIAADAAGSNNVSAVSANLQTQLTAIASFTGLVGRASSSDSALRLISADSNWWVSVSSGTAKLWRVSVATNQGSLYYGHYDLTLSSNFQTSTGIRPSTNYWHDLQAGITTDGVWRIYINSAAGPYKFCIQYNGSGGSIWANGSQTVLPTNTINYTPYYGTPTPQGTGTLSVLYYPSTYIYSTNCAGTYVTAADLAVGISNALASYNPAAATNALALASNAWQQVILAQSQIVAATNALVQTYLLNSNAWITANWSNQTLAVSLVQTNGTTNVVSVGGNNSIDPDATNLIWLALNQSIASIALKADKAWGNYAPDGTSNPDPNYMLWLNKPATLFASGCSWETYGTYAVLLSTGTVAFASGTNGAFRIGPDSTNYFGYVQGGSVTVGAVADSINVINGGQAGGYAEITYLYAGGDFPVIWFTPSLSSVDFSEISGAWVDNLDGTATVTVPAESAGGFYKATTSATFSNYFISTMPARFAGGVVGATNDTPVVYNSTISVSSGGHTYRIPAQFVQ